MLSFRPRAVKCAGTETHLQRGSMRSDRPATQCRSVSRRGFKNAATAQPGSRQGNGDGAVGPAAAPSVDAGLRQLLAVLLGLLVCDGGQEAQGGRVPLLREQQEQEAQADDAGGRQAHDTEDHLVFQNVHSYGMWGVEKQKQSEINYIMEDKPKEAAAAADERSKTGFQSAQAIHFILNVSAVRRPRDALPCAH